MWAYAEDSWRLDAKLVMVLCSLLTGPESSTPVASQSLLHMATKGLHVSPAVPLT